ncbi:MAG: cytochrome c [Pseudomonadota bacterium]
MTPRLAILGLAAAVSLGSVAIASAIDDPIEARQAIMKDTGAGIGTLVGMVRGEVEFNAVAAKMALHAIHSSSIGFPQFFPEGSETGGDTEAAPAIWEDKADFMAKAADMTTVTAAAIESPPESIDDVRTVLGAVGDTCQACHEVYRIEDE